MSDADVAFCLTHDMFHALELRDIDCDFEDWLWATNRDRRQRWAGKANMSDIDLDRLDALADNATPGPWAAQRQFSENGDWIDIVDSEGKPIDFFAFDEVKRIAVPSPDAKFIAATDPDTVRALIARVREAEVRLDQVRAFAQEQHDEIIGQYDQPTETDVWLRGFAAACSDILAILDQVKEETTNE